MNAKPQYFAGEHPKGPGATGGPDRKHSDAHDDLDFDFSMIVDDDHEGLDFALNDTGDAGNVIEQQIRHHESNLPSQGYSTKSSGSSQSIPFPGSKNSNAEGDLPHGVPAVTATASNPLYPAKQASKPRAIPQRNDHHHQQQQQQQHISSRPGSHESSGSAFLSGILNPAATTFNNTQLSHTPPTAFGTSYENSHFGKRQRSGSISGRLRSASDLEERGIIDKNQKGILRDLIICGDEDLQRALDQYEEGNPAVLHEMIQSGALQNKSVPDLDLLGDLDLDFLSMNDINDVAPEGGDSPGMYALQHQHHNHQYDAGKDAAQKSNVSAMMPPPSFPTSRQQTHRGAPTAPSSSMVSPPVYDDGIGELEFTGDFDGEQDGEYYGGAHNSSGQRQHFHMHHPDNPHRTGQETPPIADEHRLRSNSLFSALISDPRESDAHEMQYGQWMDHVPKGNQTQMETLVESPRDGHYTSATQAIPIPNADNAVNKSKTGNKAGPTRKTPGRRKSDSALTMDRQLKAKLKQELQEQKRREKQEKREQKEREKQEKKEARLAAKAEKKKKKEQNKKEQAMQVEDDEKPVHVPGSGRPRSMSDPSLKTSRDEFGHIEVERPEGWVGAYSPESRKVRIEKFLAKRYQRVWTKTVKYDVRKNFADSRLRVKGRFVKKDDEVLMRDLMSMT